MNTNSPRVNPLFASQPSSNAVGTSSVGTGRHRVAKFGGYGGVAVTAWLFTAVATGYGVSAADTPSPSSTQDAPSAGADADAAGASTSASDSGTTQRRRGLAGLESALNGARPRSRDNAAADAGSPTSNPASTATVSTSVLGHRLQLPDLRHVVDQLAHAPQTPPSSATPSQADAADTAGPASEPTPSVAPLVSTSSATAGRHAAQNISSIESKLRSAVTGAAASAQSAVPSVERTISGVLHPAPIAAAAESAVQALANVSIASNPVAPTNPVPVAALTSPVSQLASTGPLGFLNHIVTNLLNPFLHPAPSTPGPVVPIAWAVLGWVRRNLFDQPPAFSNPVTSAQTGQTVTGSLGAVDPESDPLTYTVTQQPQHGTVTIDQAAGTYTYTPNDINYTAVQTDSFAVSVTDGNKVNLLGLSQPRTAEETVNVSVQPPTVNRVILNLPSDITNPANPRYSADGKSIYFAGQPAAGGRSEIYQINVDGSGVQCVSCGVSTTETGNLAKPVPVDDGSGRVLVLVQQGNQSPRYSMLEKDANGNAQLVPILTEDGGGLSVAPNAGIIDRQREMRISPDGQHVLFTRIVVGQTGGLQALPIVGDLTREGDHYVVANSKVVYPTGEGKQWTPDGKGVVILGGQFDAGNVDDIEVDLATGDVHRVTANPDYDEDMDYSPNEQWIAIGSTRGQDALTPMTRIQRQNFLPVYVGAAVYLQYATPVNVSNQEWAVQVGDELNREDGVPLFKADDGYAARSMPSWNSTGDAVTFWESSTTLDPVTGQPVDSRLVIANLKYTTSVGPVAADRSTVVSQTAFKDLGTYVAKTTPLPDPGTYSGVNGGTAVVAEVRDASGNTTRTVTYTNYVNEDGLILNGTESAIYGPSQNTVHYLADVDVTDASGANRGYLNADATVNAFTQSMTGHITSSLDGDVETIPDPTRAHDAQQNA